MPTIISGDTGIDKIAAGAIEYADLPTGSVLQVVSTAKTDTFSTNSDTYIPVTGLSVTITPISSSSKIFVFLTACYGGDNEVWGGFKITRDGGSSFIGVGATSGSKDSYSFGDGFTSNSATNDTYRLKNGVLTFLDSPSSTSSLTYQVYTKGRSSFGSIYLNRSSVDSEDAISGKRGISVITVMEIAA